MAAASLRCHAFPALGWEPRESGRLVMLSREQHLPVCVGCQILQAPGSPDMHTEPLSPHSRALPPAGLPLTQLPGPHTPSRTPNSPL